MTKNIIFDFGDIFINLDKQVIFREIGSFGGVPTLTPELIAVNNSFEVGGISPDQFVEQLAVIYPKASPEQIKDIWNSMLLDFPDYRLEFIENLANEGTYRLFLLSNTNALHIPHVEKIMGSEKFNRFKNSFEQFYLSHEINLRKPDAEVFEFVIGQNNLSPSETLFIDDSKENTDAAALMGIRCWNLQVGKEDIIQLKNRL
ncbi:HAD-IA family hydrolase [Flavobacteriaceae bacterium TP-CH-4]|uniref:HAD-IA family hydrolase n=1 Tax=Pelagihabitans pacificus TaxID=2696054 RepID=A0A967ASK3_9FLAO|nr:HAD-IA family hydrolase [Pelagihabitans pacificus]NHF59319.1 HAD-IA family hydrolase [Pelagihabitans pacificus]